MPESSARGNRSVTVRKLSLGALQGLLVAAVLFPYGLLALVSTGSGWTFPALVPNRLDLAPWKHFLSDRDHFLAAVATSAGMSVSVASLATLGGLVVGRFVRKSASRSWRFAIYLPFVSSPVVAGVCLYDLLVRLGLIGTVPGVVLVQTVFATAFASVFFSELWSPRADRLELLVSNLGGNRRAIWRHAVIPQLGALIVICFLQTALFSWLDYGLVSVIGGGHVRSVTTLLFSYLREASVNQAAQAALVLLGPALLGFLVAGLLVSVRLRRPEPSEASGCP